MNDRKRRDREVEMLLVAHCGGGGGGVSLDAKSVWVHLPERGWDNTNILFLCISFREGLRCWGGGGRQVEPTFDNDHPFTECLCTRKL